MDKYTFKPLPELIWAVLIAAVVAAAQVIAGVPVDQLLSDPQSIAAMIGAAVARAAGAALWNGIANLRSAE